MRNQNPIQINIPNPCAEDWEQMTPAEQGRFCAHCQKCVIDFTGYSDAALYQFFSKNPGPVCGKVHVSQLNRNISLPPQPHSRLYRLFIGLGLVLVFTQMPDAHARRLPPVVIENAFYAPESDAHPDDSIEIKVVVLDWQKEPVAGAIAQLINDHVVIGAGIADADGNIVLKLPNNVDLSKGFIKIGYQSYRTELIDLNKQNIAKPFIVQMRLDVKGNMQFIIVNHKIPLIDVYEPEKHSLSADDIERMPVR